jgi:bla regulator protein blaR1
MIGEYFSSTWTAIAPGMANHLWQSTLFAIAAGLLTLLLRKHHARARHWLWLAASLKFLVPFSLLVSIGSRLSPEAAATPSVRPVLLFAMEEVTQPFSQLGVRVTTAHAPSIASSILPQLTEAISALWLVGFLAVLVLWCVRWRRVSAATKQAMPLEEGREVEVLRRLERIGGIRRPLAMLLSRTSLEPGIFGIARPVLVWPEGISQHLDDQHLEAILAHEIWHVRRRDNLFATLHMLVEAVFWFYPVVWWLGTRLIDERERACDEEVVALGKDRQIYAESILKVCEFCLGSPLPCVSGVTGADLKRRMVHIMNDRISLKLDFARKALLTLAAILAIAVPITFGLLHPSPSRAQSQLATATASAPVYSLVSIKPSQSSNETMIRSKMKLSLKDGSFMAEGVTLQRLIQMAYHVQDSQISGGPDWLNSARFDIEAKLDDSSVAAMHQQTADHKKFDDQAMLKALLSERFKLAMHPQTQTVPVYDLVVDEGGPKLQQADGTHMMHMERGELTASGTPIEFLVQQLSLHLGQTVVDKTGLKGTYAFDLHWAPDPAEDQRLEQSGEGVRQFFTVRTMGPGDGQRAKLHAEQTARTHSQDTTAPPLFAALQEQLGLKLEPQTEPIQVLVIDHAEAPAAE